LDRWEALTRYCDDGHLEIDNNAAERSLHAVVLGRKNYLFAGSDVGGDRAAAIYSLIRTAKLNGLNPEAYLREVLSRINQDVLQPSLTLSLQLASEEYRHVHPDGDGYSRFCELYGQWLRKQDVVLRLMFDQQRLGNDGTEAKLLDFQHYYNEHRTHTGRQRHPPVTGANADHSLANLSCYRWQKHCRGLYQTPMAA
jgi:hypothetical protein